MIVLEFVCFSLFISINSEDLFDFDGLISFKVFFVVIFKVMLCKIFINLVLFFSVKCIFLRERIEVIRRVCL